MSTWGYKNALGDPRITRRAADKAAGAEVAAVVRFILFGSTLPARNATLSATEEQDTASLQATVSSGPAAANLSLVATEATDTAAFSSAVLVASSLSATEAQDTTAFQVGVRVAALLLADEAPDTAAFQTKTPVSGTLVADEDPDTATFQMSVEIGAALTAQEAQDTALLLVGDSATRGNISITGMMANTGTLLNRS